MLADRLMQRTRVYRLLQGYRNLPPANLERLAEMLMRLSQLVTDFSEIVEMDINPLFISQVGQWRVTPAWWWKRARYRPPAI